MKGSGFIRSDFGQFVLAMLAIMGASFFGTLIAGAMLLAVFR
jgi:hypothetical protein